MRKFNYIATGRGGKPLAIEIDIEAKDIVHALQKIAAALPEEATSVTITEAQ